MITNINSINCNLFDHTVKELFLFLIRKLTHLSYSFSKMSNPVNPFPLSFQMMYLVDNFFPI